MFTMYTVQGTHLINLRTVHMCAGGLLTVINLVSISG